MNIVEAIITFILGGGFLSFLQFMISRHDDKNNAIKDLKDYVSKMEGRLTEKIEAIEEKADERNAVNARVRILRFADETLEGKRHSKDSFDQCLSDIDDYEDYVTKNPDFLNNQTHATVTYIKKIYTERLERHDFL